MARRSLVSVIEERKNMTTNSFMQARQLKSILGCLSSKKTSTAHRLHQPSVDEDLLISGINPFLTDAELKIAPSRAIRRMVDKTQVLTDPRNLHIRKRITHCGEVTSIASIMAAILGLNTDLVKAIALGHDMGHTPFGHDGEHFLQEISNKKFYHEIMAVVIAQHIERDGKGLNLTREVLRAFIRDACSDEECGNMSLSEEGNLITWADRFAYVTGDYNDILRIGYRVPSRLEQMMNELGKNQRERVNRLITSLCTESADAGKVSFLETPIALMFREIKDEMYKIYKVLNSSNSEEILTRIYGFLEKLSLGVPSGLVLALMTDKDVLYLANQTVLDYSTFTGTTVYELLPTLQKKNIPWLEPDLSWQGYEEPA